VSERFETQLIRSDEGLTLETSPLYLVTVANLHFQLSWYNQIALFLYGFSYRLRESLTKKKLFELKKHRFSFSCGGNDTNVISQTEFSFITNTKWLWLEWTP